MARQRKAQKLSSDHVRGDPGAVHVLIHYGNVECPQTRELSFVVGKLQQSLGPQLAYIFRYANYGPEQDPALATVLMEAAAAYGIFWETHDYLMEHVVDEDGSGFKGWLEGKGLSFEKLLSAESRQRIRQKLEKDRESARQDGVVAAPALFVNGERYEGPYEFDSIASKLSGPRSRASATKESVNTRAQRSSTKDHGNDRLLQHWQIIDQLKRHSSGEIAIDELNGLFEIARQAESEELEETAAGLLADLHPFYSNRHPEFAQRVREFLLRGVRNRRRVFANPSCRLFLTMHLKDEKLRGIAWGSVEELVDVVDCFSEADVGGKWTQERQKRVRDLVLGAAESFIARGEYDLARKVIAAIPVSPSVINGRYVEVKCRLEDQKRPSGRLNIRYLLVSNVVALLLAVSCLAMSPPAMSIVVGDAQLSSARSDSSPAPVKAELARSFLSVVGFLSLCIALGISCASLVLLHREQAPHH